MFKTQRTCFCCITALTVSTARFSIKGKPATGTDTSRLAAMSAPLLSQMPKGRRIAYLRGMDHHERLDYMEEHLSPKNWTPTHRPETFLSFEEFFVFFYLPITFRISLLSETICEWLDILQETDVGMPSFKTSGTYHLMVQTFQAMRPHVLKVLCRWMEVKLTLETYALDMGRLGLLRPFLSQFFGIKEEQVQGMDLEDARIVGYKAGALVGSVHDSVFGNAEYSWRLLYQGFHDLDDELKKVQNETGGPVPGPVCDIDALRASVDAALRASADPLLSASSTALRASADLRTLESVGTSSSSSAAAAVALWVDVKPAAAAAKGGKKKRVVRK